MAANRTLVCGGTVVTPVGALRADIAIIDESIAAVEPSIEEEAIERIDATGLHVLPGCIDPHVHFNEPGRTEWEGFSTGSSSLAAGGSTCYFDMPLNSVPPTIDSEGFALKLAAAQGASYVDFGFWGGLVPGGVDRLDELAALGVVGFKAFMADTGIEEFDLVDDLTLYEGMKRAAELRLPVAVHAENAELTRRLAERARAAGRVGVRDFLASRPALAEIEAIRRATTLAEEAGCSLHVVHVSTGRAARVVAEARDRGVDVTCETCPHYLVFDEDDLEALGPVGKCAPPLRSKPDREELWGVLLQGDVDLIASDHSPAPLALKNGHDFFTAWGGITGCQSSLTAVLTEGTPRGLTLEQLVTLTSSASAERFGIADHKGRIEAGSDADLALVDLEASAPVQAGELLYRHRHSPYVGRRLRGRVVRTILRGTTVFADGAVCSEPRGQFIRATDL